MKQPTMQEVLTIAAVVYGLWTLLSVGLLMSSNQVTNLVGWILLFSMIASLVAIGSVYSKSTKIKHRDFRRPRR